jgi:hypothetical protein
VPKGFSLGRRESCLTVSSHIVQRGGYGEYGEYGKYGKYAKYRKPALDVCIWEKTQKER